MPTILVIDDDDRLRGFLRMLLESEGFSVQEAANGLVGLASYRQGRPDLILCDIFMPEKEGLETIRELRGKFPKVKIVAMSGGFYRVGATDFLPVAKFLGADYTLAKPFDQASLLRLVHDALHGLNC